MILSAHQPAYLPYLGYFDKMARADVFVILDDVQYERNSFVNRNQIRVADKAHWLTIPLKMAGHLGKTIRQMEIDDATDWKRKHWETIRHNYAHAPFFKEYERFVSRYIATCGQEVSPEWTLEWVHFFEGGDIYIQSGTGVGGQKQELVLNLCKHFNADKFLFGALGRNYVDVGYFRDNGVEPLFQDWKYPEYKQQGDGFVPNLSVVDALFNVGLEGVKKLLEVK